MDRKEEVLRIFSIKLRKMLSSLELKFDALQEIRLRVNRPLLLVYDNQEFFLGKNGGLTMALEMAYQVPQNEIKETMEYICNYSLYAYEDELRQGFITIQGGHRVGITGRVILEKNMVKGMKHISFLNIRFAHEVKGCSKEIIPYIRNGTEIYHTLIVSPPRCGKTTLLRDLILQLSNEFTVGVVDERSEIGACYMGVPQNDLGVRTDVLDCCPKVEGMIMLIRSMAPQVVAVDEIGTREDLEALGQVIHCGAKIIATVHGRSIEEVVNQPVGMLFERVVILDREKGVGHVAGVFDGRGGKVCWLR